MPLLSCHVRASEAGGEGEGVATLLGVGELSGGRQIKGGVGQCASEKK